MGKNPQHEQWGRRGAAEHDIPPHDQETSRLAWSLPEQVVMGTYLTVPDHVRAGVESVRLPCEVDVRLTPASSDGAAWAALLVTVRAKTLFQADEIVVSGAMLCWLREHAQEARLVID